MSSQKYPYRSFEVYINGELIDYDVPKSENMKFIIPEIKEMSLEDKNSQPEKDDVNQLL